MVTKIVLNKDDVEYFNVIVAKSAPCSFRVRLLSS